MIITEEMLYAAAPEAAERFLDTLPDREGCQVSFSAAFEGEMDRLLHRRRRRPWRGLLLAAAVLGALTVGLSVGAGSQPDCQIYWSESDGVLQYSVRMEQESTRPFALAELEAVPDGFAQVRQVQEGETAQTVYRAEDGRSISLRQVCAQEYNGVFTGAYTAREAEVGDRLGMLAQSADGSIMELLWTDGPYILTLHTTGLSQEEVLAIAQDITW
jgi:hypothetical protein|nr:DUF4367 domain-containing protein [uncultured Oscillibacter sp.]